MGKMEIKNCSRCDKKVEFNGGDRLNRQSSEVRISKNTKVFLAKTEFNFLCEKCLSELDKMVRLSTKQSSSGQSELITENLHYYKENGLLVFTEFYHLQRGKCCRNSCRHCAYGFKNN